MKTSNKGLKKDYKPPHPGNIPVSCAASDYGYTEIHIDDYKTVYVSPSGNGVYKHDANTGWETLHDDA